MSAADDPTDPPPLPLVERLQFVQRQTTLLIVLSVIAVGAFFVTRSLAGATHALHRGDAARWHALGQQRLGSGNVPGAITALRRAAAMDREDRTFQLALAAAHRQAGQFDAARDVLLGARDRFPDDPDVHLRLATLEAGAGQPEQAIRHYQAALLNLWGPDQLARRRELRETYVEFLLAHGFAQRALSETLLLAGEIPTDAASHIKVGTLLRRAGDPARALQQFETALERTPGNVEALARAGETAFEIADYTRASRYLSRARDSAEAQRLLPVVDLVLALDPLRAGLSVRERHRRLARAASLIASDVAQCRTRACPDGAACEAAGTLAKELAATQAALRRAAREPDTLEAGLVTLDDVTRRVAAVCAPGQPLPPIARALQLIRADHGVAP